MFKRRFEKFDAGEEAIVEAACQRAHDMAGKALGQNTPMATWFGAADRTLVLGKLRQMHSVINDANRTVTFVNRKGKSLGASYNPDNLYQHHLLPVGKAEPLVTPQGSAIAYAFPVDRRYRDEGPKTTVSHVGSGMRIYLSEVFFQLDPDMQGATVYHEMTHKVLATNDHAYDDDCKKLPPEKAVNNADSFALYAMNC